jgi:hypothetical protein
MRCAIVKTDTNKVDNVIVADGPDFHPGGDLYCVELEENESCEIGQIYSENSVPRFSGVNTINRIYTSYQFLLRFTAEERSSFRTAGLTDQNVADFHELATAAQEIETLHPMTIAGMNYLVSIGLLTEQRKQEILG